MRLKSNEIAACLVIALGVGGVLTGAAWLEPAAFACDILWCAFKVFMGLSAVAWYQKTAKRRIEDMPEGWVVE